MSNRGRIALLAAGLIFVAAALIVTAGTAGPAAAANVGNHGRVAAGYAAPRCEAALTPLAGDERRAWQQYEVAGAASVLARLRIAAQSQLAQERAEFLSLGVAGAARALTMQRHALCGV